MGRGATYDTRREEVLHMIQKYPTAYIRTLDMYYVGSRIIRNWVSHVTKNSTTTATGVDLSRLAQNDPDLLCCV